MPKQQNTRPSRATRAAERREAKSRPAPGGEPSPAEEAAADEHELDEEVPEHYEEMTERGADQQGEGRVP
ncbi:MAG TPA: hypothetical protein VMQ81_09590 [Acidimicrobiia bacterium]|nr:hypothetical protein [Acidimicrobiia bacterium]